MAESQVTSSGRLLARLLAASWRSSPEPFECTSEELRLAAPLLLRSGAAALVWRRIRQTDLRNEPAARELQQAYRRNTLRATLQLETIGRVITALQKAGVTPLLMKGWAAARLYPEPGLRSFGDIDLCVREEEFESSDDVLKTLKDLPGLVDLHSGFDKFGGGSFDEVFSRAQSVNISGREVRVPCEEDHLRALCVHLLREGAWRPLWLCDVAAAVESRGTDFDWGLCLTGEKRRAGWVICALRLAGELLGAELAGTPAAEEKRPLPRWLVPAVLKEWGSPSPAMARRHLTPMGIYLSRPKGLFGALRNHWPNPIEATAGTGAPFNALPRLPFQLGNCLARTARFAVTLPSMLRRR